MEQVSFGKNPLLNVLVCQTYWAVNPRKLGALLLAGSQETKPRELVNGGVLKQAQFRVCNTPAGHYLHIYLDPLAGIGHLLVGFGLVCLFLLRRRKQAQLAHYAEQALRAAGIATLRNRCHSSTIPRSGLRRRISRISLVPPLCAGWDGCEAAGIGRPRTAPFHSSGFSRSRSMTSACCTSSWHG